MTRERTLILHYPYNCHVHRITAAASEITWRQVGSCCLSLISTDVWRVLPVLFQEKRFPSGTNVSVLRSARGRASIELLQSSHPSNMNKSSSLPDIAALRRRPPSTDMSISRPSSVQSFAPDSLIAHLRRGSSFNSERNQSSSELRPSMSSQWLRRNPNSSLELAAILTHVNDIMDDFGNEGDEAIVATLPHGRGPNDPHGEGSSSQ